MFVLQSPFNFQKYFDQKKVDFGKPGMFLRILVSKNILSKKKLTLENLECFSGF
jgi:hypothetical protein